MRRWNLRRVRKGYYTSPCRKYYMLQDESKLYWSVGKFTGTDCEHIEDFASYAAARNWIKTRVLEGVKI